MPDNKLVRVPTDSALIQRLDPKIESLAKPEWEWLLQARAELNRDEGLRAFFVEAKKTGADATWAIDNVAVRIAARWGDHTEQARECAQYLWDEFSQLGEGIYLASSETGKTVAVLSESNLWQPPMTARSDGTLAQPLPRIRPDLEGMIVCYISDQERERRVMSVLAQRVGQTDLLRQEGDPRLLLASRAGRRQIVEDLRRFDVEVLLAAAGGSSRAFLQHFDLVRERQASGLEAIEGCAYTRSVMGVQDQTTVNVRHDRAGTIRAAAVQGWVREIARVVANRAQNRTEVPSIGVGELHQDHLQGAQTWVCAPSVLRNLVRTDPTISVLPVEEVQPVGLVGKAGYIVVPEEFEAESLERFDRWSTLTAFKFTVFIDWSAVRVLKVHGVVHQAVVF